MGYDYTAYYRLYGPQCLPSQERLLNVTHSLTQLNSKDGQWVIGERHNVVSNTSQTDHTMDPVHYDLYTYKTYNNFHCIIHNHLPLLLLVPMDSGFKLSKMTGNNHHIKAQSTELALRVRKVLVKIIVGQIRVGAGPQSFSLGAKVA